MKQVSPGFKLGLQVFVSSAVRSLIMNLFNWLYRSTVFESDLELSAKLTYSMRVQIAQAVVVPSVGCNTPFDPRESRK